MRFKKKNTLNHGVIFWVILGVIEIFSNNLGFDRDKNQGALNGDKVHNCDTWILTEPLLIVNDVFHILISFELSTFFFFLII